MPTLEFQIELPAPLERVWAWHENVKEGLTRLTPNDYETQIEDISPLPIAVGTRVTISARVPLKGQVKFIAEYITHEPPHPVVFGLEARFVDRQLQGPFKSWQHEHEFEATGDKSTRLVDRVTYTPPAYPLSAPIDWLIIRPKLNAMFAHRHKILREVFQ